MEEIICPECGTKVPKARFCNNCGFLLEDKALKQAKTETKPGLAGLNFLNTPFENKKKVEKYIAPEYLRMDVDYCKKTLATVGGDGYDETVLYFNSKSNTYEIHHFTYYEYMDHEEHSFCAVSEKTKNEVYEYISKVKLASYKDKSMFGMCGGQIIVKFRQDDEIIRITTDNCEASLLYEVLNLLTK